MSGLQEIELDLSDDWGGDAATVLSARLAAQGSSIVAL